MLKTRLVPRLLEKYKAFMPKDNLSRITDSSTTVKITVKKLFHYKCFDKKKVSFQDNVHCWLFSI